MKIGAEQEESHEKQAGYSQCCIHELFEQQVAKAPHATALIYRDQQITYRELNSGANRVARYLRRRGVGPETLVGICLHRSPEAIAALIGIVKAGGAYVPLDPDQPALRLQEILDDSQMSVVITTEELLNCVSSGRVKAVLMDGERSGIAAEDSTNITSDTSPDNAAYVMYTSGSTGKPKGVVATHRSITNGLAAAPFEKVPGEVCSLNTSLTAGFTVSRLFLPLLCGIPLVIVPEEKSKDLELLVQVWEAQKVTNVALVTDLCRELIDTVSSISLRLRSVRTVTVGGSAVTPDLVQSFARALPHTTMLNGYASTEIGGAAIVWIASGDCPSGRLQTGRPFPNTDIYILDENLQAVTVGAVGEIYVGAAHLARCYLNRPLLTAERFLPNPLGRRPGERMYKTGDLGRSTPDGQIEVLGRTDHQVKIRGYRVELGEVEAVLRGHDDIKDCAVTPYAVSNDNRLVAYAVTKSEARPTVTGLIHWLGERLPAYMVPSAFVFLDSLPRMSSGKLDRHALPPPETTRPDLEVEYEAPRNSVEQAITKVWAEVLDLDRIGIHDNFIELGGHSLLAMQVAFRVRDCLGLELPQSWFVESPTIAEIANRMHDMADQIQGA